MSLESPDARRTKWTPFNILILFYTRTHTHTLVILNFSAHVRHTHTSRATKSGKRDWFVERAWLGPIIFHAWEEQRKKLIVDFMRLIFTRARTLKEKNAKPWDLLLCSGGKKKNDVIRAVTVYSHFTDCFHRHAIKRRRDLWFFVGGVLVRKRYYRGQHAR